MERIENDGMDGSVLKGSPVNGRSRRGRVGINFFVDALAFLALVVCVLSGWVLMAIRHAEYHHGEFGVEIGSLEAVFLGLPRYEWLNLHNLVSWIFIALIIVHLALHWRLAVRMRSIALCPDRICNKKQKLRTDN